jgi:hypothetical protein
VCKIWLEGENIAHTFEISSAKCRMCPCISRAQVKRFHLVAWELTGEKLEKLGMYSIIVLVKEDEEGRIARRAGWEGV